MENEVFKNSENKTSFIISIVAIVLVLIISVGLFLFFKSSLNTLSNEVKTELSELKIILQEDEKKEDIEIEISNINEDSFVVTDQDLEEIKTVIDKAIYTDMGPIEIKVSEVLGNYSVGVIDSAHGGHYSWYAAKVDGEWESVWLASGLTRDTVSCQVLQYYPDFPIKLAPECWDYQVQRVVDRPVEYK